ncbi:MAG: hypothetical protein JWO37_491, partial [Acidimicrobiales bacterium]|nr:hypothetical protein [Acidimicrobiales bacterium]
DLLIVGRGGGAASAAVARAVGIARAEVARPGDAFAVGATTVTVGGTPGHLTVAAEPAH